MSKTEDYIKEILKLRNDNIIDPFNFGLLKYTSWEVSLQAKLQENAGDVTPKVVEIVSSVIDEYMDDQDVKEIAELQTRLTKKYSEVLTRMDSEINSRVEEYIDRYNEAIRRIMESQQHDEGEEEENNN